MSVNGIGQNYYQNNVSTNKYNRSRVGQLYPQKQAAEESISESTRVNASVQDIYEAFKAAKSYAKQTAEEESGTQNHSGLTVWYGDKTLEEWALTDPKYTDSATGFSWYVRDGKHPYMTGENAEKFKELCKETGEPWLKKFAEMTGTIQHLDNNTTAYVGTNGTAVMSKDGKELFIDTSSMSYDIIMNMFKNLSKNGNYFDSSYWQENIQKAMQNVGRYDLSLFYTQNKNIYLDLIGKTEKKDEQIDFSRFAPNAPEEVKQAFMEASEETGYSEFGQMDHISQMLVTQVENRYNGVSNQQDVFGGSVASALQAARQMLYDLENPLVPISGRGERAVRYVEQEKEFYRKFIEKLEALSDGDTVSADQTEDYQKLLKEKMDEILAKIQKGDTETSYQIGSQSFTEKEWETFLENFDSAEEVQMTPASFLTAESTSCTYPTADPKDDDLRYITWYTEEGIFCRKEGQTEGYEWSIAFESEEQYEKVMNFIGQFPPDWNMRFAAHENFWTDFLNEEIDLEGFMNFMEGTNKGVPDYSITVGDSMYVDKDKAQWAKYLNPLGSRFYTAEEMNQRQMEIMAENEANKTKITNAKTGAFYRGLSSAVEKAESKGTGEVLGLTMLPYSDMMSYGMSAFYSENSTPEDPVIRINSNYGGENRYYDVHVNEVDPRNASQLEMFALSCYLDNQGITDGGTFGSYTRMKTYATNDTYLGRSVDLQSWENVSVKIDWVSMLQRMMEAYLQNAQTYSQYLDCDKLAAVLEKWN